jgi:glycosidase|tara:strand:- start:64 stop:1908 length:1845 start_codon:yes stop_codon:yes gene_type:complete
MAKNNLLILFLIFQFLHITAQQDSSYYKPPTWAKNQIWYQIFVERFNNSDPTNDPLPHNISSSTDFRPVPGNWEVTPWTNNWYETDKWAKNMDGDFYSKLQHRRYGGDLQGVIDKVDYLEDLGITAIYFNPVNDAPSLHKFDARNWRHIDVNFGPDPEGDNKIIESEDPGDPTTWKWTAADKLFLNLVDSLHQRGIRVIVDYSWNHTGIEFWAMKDVIENQENSSYKDWYDITSFDDPTTPENEFKYHAWFNIKSLPEIKKVNVTTKRTPGHPYEGDINPGAKKHIYDVTKRWLSPNGDISKGIDGYRLDVADHIGLEFWRDYRKFVKSVNPDAYIIGEIWWEAWPDRLMDPTPYMQGDIFDAVMFYHLYKPARYFFANTDLKLDAAQLKDSLEFLWTKLDKPMQYSMMNTAATHDSPRLLTSFDNKSLYKVWAKPHEDSTYNTGLPDEETYTRVKLYLMHQFTIPGAPQIWNGDEMGMWGADDPDCRKPLWWNNMDFDDEYQNNFQPGEKEYTKVTFNEEHFDFYKKIIRIRRDNPVLATGDIKFIVAENNKLMYSRFDNNDEIIVLFNLESEPESFELQKGYSYLNLFSNSSFKSSIILEPFSGMILKQLNK